MAIIKSSTYPEEWYETFRKCLSCGEEFMCSNPNYCPCCGEFAEQIVFTDDMSDESEDKK